MGVSYALKDETWRIHSSSIKFLRTPRSFWTTPMSKLGDLCLVASLLLEEDFIGLYAAEKNTLNPKMLQLSWLYHKTPHRDVELLQIRKYFELNAASSLSRFNLSQASGSCDFKRTVTHAGKKITKQKSICAAHSVSCKSKQAILKGAGK